jgi:RNA recognition motif-containing protein
MRPQAHTHPSPMLHRDGQSRQMAFVGFKTEKDAQAALSYFNNSYMDTFKVAVEFARKYGDASIARPWSRHSQGGGERQGEKGGRERRGGRIFWSSVPSHS